MMISSCSYRFPLGKRSSIRTNKGLYIDYSLNPKGFLLATPVFDEVMQSQMIQLFPGLPLVSRQKAGLYMKVTHKKMSSNLLGDERLSKNKSGGINNYYNEAKEPLDPFLLEDIKAKEYYVTTQQVSLHVTVELWDLYKQEKIFIKDYSFANQSPFLFHPRSHLLESTSQEASLLRESSELIATALISDLLSVL